VWRCRPFASLDALHTAMVDEMNRASIDEQLRLLRAHPDLGAQMKMSDASVGEQAGAGLDRLAAEQFAQLQRLNADYRAKFDFPFLFAVKGSTPVRILEALQQRLPRDRPAEFAEAKRQVAAIARFRLEDSLS